jgi:hypothetical protein
VQWYALGLGIHINDSQPGKKQGGIASVADITGKKIIRKEFVRQFRQAWYCRLSDSPGTVRSGLKRFTRIDEKIEESGENNDNE